MNKEEIIEVAKLAEDYLPDLDPQEEFYTICESLIAAARFLKMVEVVTVEEIEKIFNECRYFDHEYQEWFTGDRKAAEAIHNLMYNRPVITIKKGEV